MMPAPGGIPPHESDDNDYSINEENDEFDDSYQVDDGDDSIPPEIAMLHDKHDILRKYGNISNEVMDKQPTKKVGKSKSNTKTTQSKRRALYEKVSGYDNKFIKQPMNENEQGDVTDLNDVDDEGVADEFKISGNHRENSFVPNPRNIGNIAGMLSRIDYNFMRNGSDDDDINDDDGSSSDDNNGREDFRVVSLFAKQIYNRNEDQNKKKTDKFLQTMKDEAILVNRRDTVDNDDNEVGKENTINANKPLESVEEVIEKAKNEWNTLLTQTSDHTPSQLPQTSEGRMQSLRPASETNSSIEAFLPPSLSPTSSSLEPAIMANESALLEAEEIQKVVAEANTSNTTSMSSSSSNIPTAPPSSTPEQPSSQSSAGTFYPPIGDKNLDEQAKQRYHPSEMRHRLLLELRRQEDLFNYAIELAELEKIYTQQSAHEIVNDIRQKADEEIRKERAQSESMLQQQAYELAVANAMASAQLALEKEALAANKTVDDLKLQLQQQGKDVFLHENTHTYTHIQLYNIYICICIFIYIHICCTYIGSNVD